MSKSPASGTYVSAQLSVMMFLQFFIWGGWYVTVGNYMRAHGMAENIYWAYTVGPIAAIISPFFLGMIADRFFATERVLGMMHILGGVALMIAPQFTPAEGASHWPFILWLLVHMLCYMPTLGLTNTLAFHHLTNQEKQFPLIRVFGTVGWIVANIVVSLWLDADKEIQQFYVAGGAAVLLGVLSFGLPHTPPPAKGKSFSVRDALGLDSLVLLKERSFAVFIVSSFLICIPLAAYYNYAPVFGDAAGFHNPAYNMSFGQMAEVIFMLIMPWFFIRLGVKWMLLVGMCAWILRYGLFAGAATEGVFWMIMGGIVLHGICYDFFFVTGFIYVDKKASAKIRGQAQGFLVLVTQGLGMFIGALLAGQLVNGLETPSSKPLTLTATALRKQCEANDETIAGLREQQLKALDLAYERVEPLLEQAKNTDEETSKALTAEAEGIMYAADSVGAEIEAKSRESGALWDRASDHLLLAHNWKYIWLTPCIMAAIIAAAFLALFKDNRRAADNGAGAGGGGEQG